jgi:hypothetical protein
MCVPGTGLAPGRKGDPEGKTPIGRFVLGMGPPGSAKKRLLGK